MFQEKKISHTMTFNIQFIAIDFSIEPPFFIKNLLVMIRRQATQLLHNTNVL